MERSIVSSELQLPQRRGREGNRWANERPTSEEISAWFEANVRLHDGMVHEDWVHGVTLIESTEDVTEIAGFDSQNRPILVPDVKHLYFIPYVKVEARIAYFNRLMENNPDWVGFAHPIPSSQGLPLGYSMMEVQLPSSIKVPLISYTIQYVVFRRNGLTWVEQKDADGVKRYYPKGEVVMAGAPGTKSVPLIDRWSKLDENAMMKAQTGAIGRALGMLGMLVIPGTGVASADDMREMVSTEIPSVQAVTPVPVQQEDDTILRLRAKEMIETLQQHHPADLLAFQAWAKERGFTGGLASLSGTPLKGVVKKLEKALDQAGKTPVADAPDAAPSDAPDIDISGDTPPTEES
jgi:hypothetical protein